MGTIDHDLDRYPLVRVDDDIWMCDLCGDTFADERDAHDHLRRDHAMRNSPWCHLCIGG